MKTPRPSRRKIAAPKSVPIALRDGAVGFIPDQNTKVAWFASSKTTARSAQTARVLTDVQKLELTEAELIARGLAESRFTTIEAFVRNAVIASAKVAIVNGGSSKVDYAKAFAALQKIGRKITPTGLAREAKGNDRSAKLWLIKNGHLPEAT